MTDPVHHLHRSVNKLADDVEGVADTLNHLMKVLEDKDKAIEKSLSEARSSKTSSKEVKDLAIEIGNALWPGKLWYFDVKITLPKKN